MGPAAVTPGQHRALGVDERLEGVALLSAGESTRYGSLFAFLVNTGLRRGEALALSWADVDLKAGLLRVRGTLARVDGDLVVTDPKTAKSRRSVPLSPDALDLLRRIKVAQTAERLRAGSQWRQSGYVFTTSSGNRATRATPFGRSRSQPSGPACRPSDFTHCATLQPA
jgi:integrase